MGGKGSGRKPRPSALQGLFGRKDRINKQEPVLLPAGESFDTPPPALDGDAEAIAEWTRVVPTLRRVGLVSDLEWSSLIAYCRVWSRLVLAESLILADGAIVAGAPHPALRVANDAIGQCLKFWAEHGMTPSGRSKLVSLVKRDTPAVSKWAGVV